MRSVLCFSGCHTESVKNLKPFVTQIDILEDHSQTMETLKNVLMKLVAKNRKQIFAWNMHCLCEVHFDA